MITDGQKLWWLDKKNWTEGVVTVVQRYDTYFVVEYNGKYYKRDYEVIGKILFTEPQLRKIRKCDNCFRRHTGDCTSLSGVLCEDFIARQKVTKEEMDLWPAYGDATAFRLKDYKRFR